MFSNAPLHRFSENGTIGICGVVVNHGARDICLDKGIEGLGHQMVYCTSSSFEANTELTRSCEAGPDGALTLQQLATSRNPAQRRNKQGAIALPRLCTKAQRAC